MTANDDLGFVPDSKAEDDLGFVPNAPTPKQPSSVQQEFNKVRAGALAQNQEGLGARVLNLARKPFELATTLVEQAAGIPKGIAEIAGEASTRSPLEAGREFEKNLLQSTLEAGARIPASIGTMAANKLNEVVANPKESAKDVALRIIDPTGTLSTLAPKSYDEADINRMFENLKAQQGESEKAVLPQLVGKANIPLAESLPLLTVAGEVPGVIKGIKSVPAVSGTSRVVGGIKNAVVGGTKSMLENLTPKSLVEDIVSTLDPKANAINPSKTVQAVKDTTQAVKRVLPDIPPEAMQHPQSLADAATQKLQEIHAQRAQMAGEPVTVSLDPMADAFSKLANDPVIQKAFPKQIASLQEEAANLRGTTMSAQDAERYLQIQNAKNAMLHRMTGIDYAKAVKSDPMLAASSEAAQALREQLDAAIGDKFGELGKDYGAWRNIAESAQRQAVKQMKMEKATSLYEGLGAMQAALSSGEPVKALASVWGGKIAKYMSSPASRFQSTAQRLQEAIANGEIKPRTP